MKIRRHKYQQGSIRRVKRANGFAWEFRFYVDTVSIPVHAKAGDKSANLSRQRYWSTLPGFGPCEAHNSKAIFCVPPRSISTLLLQAASNLPNGLSPRSRLPPAPDAGADESIG
jgi:hypothetical protein